MDLVSGLIAVYAASVSSYLGYRQIIRDRRRIEVFCRPVVEPSRDGSGMEGYIGVRVVNVGHRPVEIIEVWFDFPDGMSAQLTTVDSPRWSSLPSVLNDGASVTARFDEERFGYVVERNGVPDQVRVIDNLDDEYSTPVPQLVIETAAESLSRAREIERELSGETDEEEEANA
jgi:hypothetical protein